MSGELESFPHEVKRALNYYVYRLIDPRNGETFYVGKGKGDRVFAHVREKKIKSGSIIPDNKFKRIREIRNAGFEVTHVIHRHGMDQKTAFEVEAALIDAYLGLANVAGGIAGSAYGVMHAKEIIQRYCAKEADFQHKALLLNVGRSAYEMPLYEATRFAWGVNKSRAEQAEVILPTVKGLIIGAFVAKEWLTATTANFPGRPRLRKRYGFNGKEAPKEIKALYVDKRVPKKYRGQAPFRYTWTP